MSNPYLIEGPALISFSGGETSRKMIEEMIEAHDGRLPDDCWITFSNTGKEDEKTLRFIDQCERRWQHRIWWIEYQVEEPGYHIVTFETASRKGEPFEALILKKGYVPNRGAPYCSIELKARTIRNFVKNTYQVRRWKSVLGLRADETLGVYPLRIRNCAPGGERLDRLLRLGRGHGQRRRRSSQVGLGQYAIRDGRHFLSDRLFRCHQRRVGRGRGHQVELGRAPTQCSDGRGRGSPCCNARDAYIPSVRVGAVFFDPSARLANQARGRNGCLNSGSWAALPPKSHLRRPRRELRRAALCGTSTSMVTFFGAPRTGSRPLAERIAVTEEMVR